MPRCTTPLGRRMIERFGSLKEKGPSDHLRAKGWYNLGTAWFFPPDGIKILDMPVDERECALFLMHEHQHLFEDDPDWYCV